MKAWEICKKENVGKLFIDNSGKKWMVCEVLNHFYCDLLDEQEEYISNKYYLSTIAELDFEEVIDWSKVPVDTPVIVTYNGKQYKRHFAKYEDGKVYTWNNGLTSFTVDSKEDYSYWGNVELYEEDEE